MESRFQRLFLALLLVVSVNLSWAQEEDNELVEDIIGESLDRPELKEDKLDTENFEIGAYVGIMSVEDFGTNALYGVQFGYHITEDFFVEANIGYTKTSETSFETLSGSVQLLSDKERDFKYYNFNVGWNFLPSEVFIGSNYAFNSNLYLIGGVGNTEFAGNTYFTFNVGVGYRFFVNDWFAVRLDIRDHIFESDIFGEDKLTHNLDFHTGVTFFF